MTALINTSQRVDGTKVDVAADGEILQAPAHGSPRYELAFPSDGRRKEATFREDGTFVEEE